MVGRFRQGACAQAVHVKCVGDSGIGRHFKIGHDGDVVPFPVGQRGMGEGVCRFVLVHIVVTGDDELQRPSVHAEREHGFIADRGKQMEDVPVGKILAPEGERQFAGVDDGASYVKCTVVCPAE